MAWCCAPPRPKSRGGSYLTTKGCSTGFGASTTTGGTVSTATDTTSFVSEPVILGTLGTFGSSAAGVLSLDLASIASTSALAVPYFPLETVITSCRRAADVVL